MLTKDGEVYVWWEQGLRRLERGAGDAGENDLSKPSEQGVLFALEVDTLRLPPLPTDSSSHKIDEKIKLLACGDNFIIALTDQSRLYYLSLEAVPDPARPHARQGAVNDPEDSPVRSRESMARLDAELLSGRRKWRSMSRFCEMEEISKLDEFKNKTISRDLRITHVSAHFNSFAACMSTFPILYSGNFSTDALLAVDRFGSFVVGNDRISRRSRRFRMARASYAEGHPRIARSRRHQVCLSLNLGRLQRGSS